MKRFAKLLILPIIVLTCGIVLAACGNNNPPPPVGVTSITISGNERIVIGTSNQYTASIVPDNATNKRVIWSVVTGEGDISVDGVLEATEGTNITIRATSVSNSTIYGEKAIEVVAVPDLKEEVKQTEIARLVKMWDDLKKLNTSSELKTAMNAWRDAVLGWNATAGNLEITPADLPEYFSWEMEDEEERIALLEMQEEVAIINNMIAALASHTISSALNSAIGLVDTRIAAWIDPQETFWFVLSGIDTVQLETQRASVTTLANQENMQAEVIRINNLITALANEATSAGLSTAIDAIDSAISSWSGIALVGINVTELEEQRVRIATLTNQEMEAEVIRINNLISALANETTVAGLRSAVTEVDTAIETWNESASNVALSGINTAALETQRARITTLANQEMAAEVIRINDMISTLANETTAAGLCGAVEVIDTAIDTWNATAGNVALAGINTTELENQRTRMEPLANQEAMAEEVIRINDLITALANQTTSAGLSAAIDAIDNAIDTWTGIALVGINKTELATQRERIDPMLAMENEVNRINDIIYNTLVFHKTSQGLWADINHLDYAIKSWTGLPHVGIDIDELEKQRDRIAILENKEAQSAAEVIRINSLIAALVNETTSTDLSAAIGVIDLDIHTWNSNAENTYLIGIDYNELGIQQERLSTLLTQEMQEEVGRINSLISALENETTSEGLRETIQVIDNARQSWLGIMLEGINEIELEVQRARIATLANKEAAMRTEVTHINSMIAALKWQTTYIGLNADVAAIDLAISTWNNNPEKIDLVGINTTELEAERARIALLAVASEVIDLIDALPNPWDARLEHREAILAVWDAFGLLAQDEKNQIQPYLQNKLLASYFFATEVVKIEGNYEFTANNVVFRFAIDLDTMMFEIYADGDLQGAARIDPSLGLNATSNPNVHWDSINSSVPDEEAGNLLPILVLLGYSMEDIGAMVADDRTPEIFFMNDTWHIWIFESLDAEPIKYALEKS